MVWPHGAWLNQSVTKDDALCAVECIGSGDDDLVACRQPFQDFDLGDAGGAELYRMALGNISADDIGKAAALLVDEGPATDHQDVVPPADKNADGETLA